MTSAAASGAAGAGAKPGAVAAATSRPAAATSAASAAPRALVWLRNDLRTHDNPALAAAAAAVARGEASSVVPFVPFDPRNHGRSPLCGFPKTGAFRAKFRLEAAADLRRRLAALGSGLVVRPQPPEEIVAELLLPLSSSGGAGAGSGGGGGAEAGGGIVFVSDEPFPEEREAVEAVREALSLLSPQPVLRVVEPRGGASTLLHPDDLDFGSGMERLPDLFTAFRTAVERDWAVRPPVAAPARGSLPLPRGDAGLAAEMTAAVLPLTRVEDLGPLIRRACESQGVAPYELATPAEEGVRKLAVLDFEGGETAAYARLNHYLFGSKAASTYFETRNGMLGADYSTKFSPWLAAGCLSPRIIADQLKKYEGLEGANKSTYWIVFELLWRDFFHFYARKHGSRVFAASGVSRKEGVTWRKGPAADAAFHAWTEGKTGRPLVDANMRELAKTGFMSNRGRQNVASFLCHSLGLDWRRGAEHFENLLNDSDTASNWGNWMMAAGFSGNRINVFNIAKQSMDYDPQGDYVMHHLPELQGLRKISPPAMGQKIHDPRSLSSAELQAAGLVMGVDYPLPIATVQSPHSSADRGGRGGGGGRGRGGGERGGDRGRGGRNGSGNRGGNERRGGSKDPRERRVRDGGARPATDGGLKGRPVG